MAQRVDPRSYLPGSMVGGAPIRVDARVTPRLPLHPTGPINAPYPQGFESNGVARGPSGRKRRAVGTGPGPRPPSIDSRQAQASNGRSQSTNHPSSFASRARGFSAGEDHMSAEDAINFEAAAQPAKDSRRREPARANSYHEYEYDMPPVKPMPVQGSAPPAARPAQVLKPDLTQASTTMSTSVSVPEPQIAPAPAPISAPTEQMEQRRQTLQPSEQREITRDVSPLDSPLPSPDGGPVSLEFGPDQRDDTVIPHNSNGRRQDSSSRQQNPQQPTQSSVRRASAGAPEPWEWAADKSPLQKLEGRLNTISLTKEEKRARVERAEQRLRERRRSEQGGEAGLRRSTSRRTSGARYSVPKDTRPPAQVYLDTYANIEQENPSYSSATAPTKNRQSLRDETVPSATDHATSGSDRQVLGTSNVPEDATSENERTPELSRGESRRIRIQRPVDAPSHSVPKRKSGLAGRSTDSNDQPARQPSSKEQQRRLNDSIAQDKGVIERPRGDSVVTKGLPERNGRYKSPEHSLALPPQRVAGVQAKQRVGFDAEPLSTGKAALPHEQTLSSTAQHPSNIGAPPLAPNLPQQHLEEWRRAGAAKLAASDLVPKPETPKENKAWWEKGDRTGTKGAERQSINNTTAFDGSYDSILNESASFDPPLYLQCGPLLRYTGMKRDKLEGSSSGQKHTMRETWRGSVMIVTLDARSRYQPAPTLRLFAEPMKPLPPPQQVNAESEESLPPEYLDPVAGMPKLSRTGRTVYVKPVEDLQSEMDLSHIEGDEGLFEQFRTAVVPTAYGRPDPSTSGDPALRTGSSGQPHSKSRYRSQEVKGIRLHAERGVTFWRFNLEIELGAEQARVAYRINNSPSVGFWVPAKGQVMNIMFHSCNGFSNNVNPANLSGPDPLWRDVLNSHQIRPFHVMIGGGDNIYNDAVMDESSMLRAWLELKSNQRHGIPFSPDFQDETERFYLGSYSMWFSQGLFGMANSQIPMVNIWNDRDIIDGYGSYPDNFMSAPVFCGLGAAAYKYYMLFQHQSVPAETSADEPSWLLGAAPGPYISEVSRSIFISLGNHVSFLGLDCRTERTKEEVVSQASYDLVFDRCWREIVQGETKHLIVLLGVPIAYPRLVWLENLLTSRAMDPIKAVGRMGYMGGFLNKFDAGVDVLDDLDNQWTAKSHKDERNWLVQELQDLAAEKSVRITFLGGDVQMAGMGQFYSNPKLGMRKDRDHRYMPNIISSAIVNNPPPDLMADAVNKRNKTHHLDSETDEDMIPMFTHDVDDKIRNNKRLLTRRNWCSIREYQPGSTPPPSRSTSPSEGSMDLDEPRRPMGRLQRTLSLTRDDVKPGNLIRRLSQRGPPPTSMKHPIPNSGYPPSPPDSDQRPSSSDGQASFQQRAKMTSDSHNVTGGHPQSSAPLIRPNFQRRPTNLSVRAAKKGGAEDDEDDHVNLEHGLDIVLNCEVSPKDPAGITVPYRLLVPALWYEGEGKVNTAVLRRKSLLSRIGSIRMAGRTKSGIAKTQGQGNWGGSMSSLDRSENQSLERPLQSRPQGMQQAPTAPRPQNEQRFREPPKSQEPKMHHDLRNAVPLVKPDSQRPVRRTPPPPVGVQMMEMRGQDRLEDYYDDPPVQDGGYPGRRPSKLDRVLGIGSHRQAQKYGDDDHVDDMVEDDGDYHDGGSLPEHRNRAPPARRPSKLQRVLSLGRRRPKRYADYHSEDDLSDEYDSYSEDGGEQHFQSNGRPVSMGYSGIEAYQEKEKGWKRWFSSG